MTRAWAKALFKVSSPPEWVRINHQPWQQTCPQQLRGSQKLLATLLIHLEETEEQLEALHQSHSELLARIASVQVWTLFEKAGYPRGEQTVESQQRSDRQY